MLYGVPQGSVLRLFLVNIELIDSLFECEDDNIYSYPDDTTPYFDTEDNLKIFFCNYITLKN